MKKIVTTSNRLKIAAAALVLALSAYVVEGYKTENYLKNRVVQLINGHASCSGEQVTAPSGATYILTAAHCRGLADEQGNIRVLVEEGGEISRKVIAEDMASDLLLIEGLPKTKGLDIADSMELGQHVRTFTHGLAMKTYRTEGVLVQDELIAVPVTWVSEEYPCEAPKLEKLDFFGMEICIMSVQETMTTAFVAPGSSGGPVVDDSGDLIGVVSVSGQGFGGLVRLKDIKSFLSAY